MMQLERKLVEEPVIENLQRKGWRYVEARDLNRRGIDEPLLIEDLRRKILEINKDVELTDGDLKNVINKLQGASTNQNGHKEILKYFKYGIPIKTEKEKVVKYIQIFDYNNIRDNDFVCTNQVEFYGRDKIRLDVLLFVNGIPLVNIECKNPYTLKQDYFSAYKQIKRYEKTFPELYKYIQIGVAFAERVKYFPIVPWVDYVKQEIWKCDGIDDENQAIFEMLKPDVLLDILKNFIFVRGFREEMTKVIARYMQYRAANKIYQRVKDNLDGKTDKNRGLIWHWQGSGKTLTMIFSAHKLYFDIGNPTIFFIVDRKDIENQFSDELRSLDLNFNFEKIESIEKLKEVLTHDSCRGKRGVFLTLLHKFNLEKEFIFEELGDFAEIRKRKDIICFLDEVHRSQYGILAFKMKEVLSNAFFFGFTGTPISYKDRNTYKKFGYIREGDPELYLDKYFIDEAERDGFVVPIVYELRKEEVNLKDEDIEWYLEQDDVDDIADEIELKNIKGEISKRINEITAILENPKNIELICEDIAKHFKENFDGKFKGLIVTASRKACIRFKKILDKYLDPKYTEVVITFDRNQDEEVNNYRQKLIERFKTKDVDDIIKKIIDDFRKEEYPKILIVVDMLITGFDEPKLAVIYLYRILKNHRLLQTIARVNRPHEGKPSGFLVDYVGVFKYINKALKAYTKEDFNVIKTKFLNIKAQKEEFMKIVEDLLEKIFDGLVGKFEKEAFDEALEILKDVDKGNYFLSKYSELRKMFEFLKSQELDFEVLEKYKWFSCVYEYYYKKLIRPDIDESKLEKYFKKTIELIHNLIEPKGLKEIRPLAIDLNYIMNIKNSDLTERQKYIGILNALKYICVLKSKNPIYKSIADKVRELVKRWQEDDEDILSLVHEINGILNFIESKEREKKETSLNDIEFGIKIVFEKFENKLKLKPDDPESFAKEIYGKIQQFLSFPNWYQNPAISKNIEKKIREFITDLKPKYKFPLDLIDDLQEEIYETILDSLSSSQ
jgi:type I restriction enzyme R subunit